MQTWIYVFHPLVPRCFATQTNVTKPISNEAGGGGGTDGASKKGDASVVEIQDPFFADFATDRQYEAHQVVHMYSHLYALDEM